MPSGGSWEAYNKRRPGAYINFVSVPRPVGSLGVRGTVAVALPMTWGPEDGLIRVTGQDLLNGKSIPLIGCDAFTADESLPYRIALSGAFTGLFFRSDSGATKAAASIIESNLTANAKYAGTSGNSITIVIASDAEPAVPPYEVSVLFRGLVKETFKVETIYDFANLESAYVDFVLNEDIDNPTIPVTAGIPLTGAVNGTVSADRYAAFFGALDHEQFQCMAINSVDPAVAPLIVAQMKIWREKRGKKVQAVVYDYPAADYEGIISVNQGFTTQMDTVGTDLFPLWTASMTAGAAINQSLTCQVVEGAISIINPLLEDDVDAALDAGRFVLTYRQDGAVCVEQDINTLHTFTPDKSYAFSKNRAIRTIDELCNTTALIFNRNYAGKVDNNDIGRNQFKGELISLGDTLLSLGAIQNFDGPADIVVLPGESVDSVIADWYVQVVDSMEKLYLTVHVDA